MRNSTHITITFSRGWLVTFAAAGLGLVFGVLYVWSVVKSGIPHAWGWSNAEKAMPYSTMAIVFSIIMVPAGQLQDRFGPRLGVMCGGFLAGLGCIVAGLGGSSLLGYIIGVGVITGAGVGLGYSALTPAAIKWFPREKTGLVAGIVVAGAGLAPVPMAPLAAWLLNLFSSTNSAGVVELGVSATMIVLGCVIWFVVACLVWFIYNPPTTFIPLSKKSSVRAVTACDFSSKDMLKTLQFWLLYFMYFSGASAGLVFIGVAAELGKKQMGQWAFVVVVVLSLGNTLGRILVGFISDKIGRELTLFAEFVCQAVMVGTLYFLTRQGDIPLPAILSVVFMIGLNYGSNLTLFPATCRDYFGIRSFGVNYGCLFTAFGVAGLLMPLMNGFIRDVTGKPDLSYLIIIGLLVTSAIMALLSHRLGTPTAQLNSKD